MLSVFSKVIIRFSLVLLSLALWLPRPGAAAGSESTDLKQRLLDKVRLVQRDSTARAAVIKEGRDFTSTFCVYCHGDDGNSSNVDIPNLAQQNPVFLLAQLRQFSASDRKDDYAGVMQRLAKTFTPEQEVTLAVYFASVPLTKPATGDPALAAKGRSIFTGRCVVCHGPEGLGREEFPRIAGQEPGYVVRTLRNFRDLDTDRQSSRMSTVTHDLTNADIDALSAYVATLPVKASTFYPQSVATN